MSDRHDQCLDDLLRRWAADRAPSEERLAQLHEATIAELASARFVDLADIAPRRPTPWRLYGAVATLAAAVLFALMLPRARRAGLDNHAPLHARQADRLLKAPPDKTPVHAKFDDVPAAARLDEKQLARKAKLLKVLQETFPNDLLWVAETEGEIQIGLRSDATPPADEDNPSGDLAVRIVVAARRIDQPAWTTLCQADVLTEPEELVEVPLDAKGGGRLAVWVCLLPDGLMAVDTDLSLPGVRGLHASASTVQREGVPCRADSGAAGGWEYRVFQTVGRLPEKGAATSPSPRLPKRS